MYYFLKPWHAGVCQRLSSLPPLFFITLSVCSKNDPTSFHVPTGRRKSSKTLGRRSVTFVILKRAEQAGKGTACMQIRFWDGKRGKKGVFRPNLELRGGNIFPPVGPAGKPNGRWDHVDYIQGWKQARNGTKAKIFPPIVFPVGSNRRA